MKKSAVASAAASLVKRQRAASRGRRLDFARAVVAGAQLRDARWIDVEADDRRAGARERDRHRQADIAEPDHGDPTIRWPSLSPGELDETFAAPSLSMASAEKSWRLTRGGESFRPCQPATATGGDTAASPGDTGRSLSLPIR